LISKDKDEVSGFQDEEKNKDLISKDKNKV